MFIDKISICNLFVYYKKVEVEFSKAHGKNLYLIYGKNGYGKTSFINSMKILFLGSGYLNGTNKIPKSLENMGKFASIDKFIIGDNAWRGILNTKARSNIESEFYIEAQGVYDDKKFSILRSWDLKGRDILEHLELTLGNEKLTDFEANERLSHMVQPEFIDFFFFDGELIEKMASNLQGEILEKIKHISNTPPIEFLLKQAESTDKELKLKESDTNKNTKKYNEETLNKNLLEEKLKNKQESLEENKNEIEKTKQKLRNFNNEINSIEANTNLELKSLKEQESQILESLMKNKEEFLEELKKTSIIFYDNPVLESLNVELENITKNNNSEDIKSLEKLMPSIKEFAKTKEQGAILLEFLNELPVVLSEKINTNGTIPLDLKDDLSKFKDENLIKIIKKIADFKRKLKDIKDDINNITLDELGAQKIKNLREKITENEEILSDLESQKESLNTEKGKLEKELEICNNSIYNLLQQINTKRIENKLKTLEIIRQNIDFYIKRLKQEFKKDLPQKILQHYKKLIVNNIENIEMDDDFRLFLKDANGNTISTTSQSAGEKQILSIAIFWALNELSHAKIPLIIDTPLARIDKENRKNIIENYYKNQGQIIILPTDTEFGMQEYRIASNKVAKIYKIEQDETHSYSQIRAKSHIDEILE